MVAGKSDGADGADGAWETSRLRRLVVIALLAACSALMVTAPLCQVTTALSIGGAQRSGVPAQGHTARTPSSICSLFFFLGPLLFRVGKITPWLCGLL